MFEFMINHEHGMLEFNYVVDGEVISKLFYLVNGLYPSLSHFISSEPDLHTKIAYSFAADKKLIEMILREGSVF